MPLITLAGMNAANAEAYLMQHTLPFQPKDFERLIIDQAIGENDVIGFLYHS